jgi:Zn-dependent peptidase ImmA (M78 family)/transcriptional regulator with XRE-family HTH domain
MPAINPNILIWARETAGLSIDDAAEKLGIAEARGVSPLDRLLAYEAGQQPVSRTTLVKMSKIYRRSLLTFYLEAPPRKGDRGEDFRTLPSQHTADEPLVDALLRDIRARQSMVRTLLEEDDDAEALPFVGSTSVSAGVSQVLSSIQSTLDLDLATFRSQGSPEAAFTYLRSRVEAVGVFVLLIGNLGSHHTNLDVSAFRGFALADPLAPFVVINDQDAKSAWAFTLLHEVCHLWIGASGVSGAWGESRLEKFCNDVASAFLLPSDELAALQIEPTLDRQTVIERIGEFARERLLSRSLVAYRLFQAQRLSEHSWQSLTQDFRDQWRQQRDAQRVRSREQKGGPNYYVVRRHKLGSALLKFVDRNMNDGALTPTKAGKVLGVKPRSVAALLSTLHPQMA